MLDDNKSDITIVDDTDQRLVLIDDAGVKKLPVADSDVSDNLVNILAELSSVLDTRERVILDTIQTSSVTNTDINFTSSNTATMVNRILAFSRVDDEPITLEVFLLQGGVEYMLERRLAYTGKWFTLTDSIPTNSSIQLRIRTTGITTGNVTVLHVRQAT